MTRWLIWSQTNTHAAVVNFTGANVVDRVYILWPVTQAVPTIHWPLEMRPWTEIFCYPVPDVNWCEKYSCRMVDFLVCWYDWIEACNSLRLPSWQTAFFHVTFVGICWQRLSQVYWSWLLHAFWFNFQLGAFISWHFSLGGELFWSWSDIRGSISYNTGKWFCLLKWFVEYFHLWFFRFAGSDQPILWRW